MIEKINGGKKKKKRHVDINLKEDKKDVKIEKLKKSKKVKMFVSYRFNRNEQTKAK